MSKNSTQLINNIIGQLNGVKKMIEDEKDCIEILNQLKSIKSATNSLISKHLGDSLENCIDDLSSNNKNKLNSIVTEITKLN